MDTLTSAPSFTLDQVDKVYIGKGNCCRCGCGGEYFYAKEEVNAKKIAHYLKKMASGKYAVDVQDGYIFQIDLSKSGHDRVATFYLHDRVEALSTIPATSVS